MSDSKEFLEKLEVLCREYSVAVGGCGCCDSPFVQEHEWKAEEMLAFSRGDRRDGFEICVVEGPHLFSPHRKCLNHPEKDDGYDCE